MDSTTGEEGPPATALAADYLKLYNAVVEFKQKIAKAFLDEGLLEESSKLEAIKTPTAAIDTACMTNQVQRSTADIILVFNLIAELIKSNIVNKTTTQAEVSTLDTSSQTDPTPESLVIQAVDAALVKTENNDEYWEDTNHAFSPVAVMETPKSSQTPQTTPTPRRKSMRASVLNRKSFANPVRQSAAGAQKRKQGEVMMILSRGAENKKTLALVPSEAARSHKGGVLATNLYERTPEGMFRCKECGKQSKLQTNIRKHLRKHTGEREFHCSQCSKKFIYQQDLSRHLKTHSSVKPCPKSKSKISETQNQTKKDSSESSQVESVCVSPAKSKTRTERIKSGEKAVKEEGDAGEISIALTTDAMYITTEEGCYRCIACGTETKDRSNIRKHFLKWHAGEKQYQCSKCPKAFPYKESLKHHQKVHLDPSTLAFERTQKGFSCKHCKHESKNRSNMVKHVKRRHLNVGEKPYQCTLCPAVFAYPRSLKRHELVHQGIRPYQCVECQKSFFDQTSLRTHRRVHTTERPYICQICGDRFRQSEGLKGHMRRHTGDRPYVCERCGMAFAAKRSLVRHIRVHTGERPYSCDQCVAAFADWTTLHNHKLVHRDTNAENAGESQGNDGEDKNAASEVKPYQCQFCGIRYRQPLSLKRHLRIHSNNGEVKKSPAKKPKKRKEQDGEEGEGDGPTALHRQYRPYACDQCGERFKHLRGYETHMSKHENGAFTVKKTPAKRAKRVTSIPHLSNQEIEQAATILASVAVNSTSVAPSNSLPMSVIHAQPASEPVTIIDASAITAMSITDPTQLTVASAPVVSNAGEVIHHYTSGDVTQVIQYPDGTLSQVTTIVPQHNPHPPAPPQPNISVMRPIDLLGNVTNVVVFETQDGNVVVDQTSSLA